MVQIKVEYIRWRKSGNLRKTGPAAMPDEKYLFKYSSKFYYRQVKRRKLI